MVVSYAWRGRFADDEVNALHAEGFDHPDVEIGWRRQVERHSLGWVCAHDRERLVGFVNVAWDGGVHAFVLDTLVHGDARHEGVGTGLLEVATIEARAAGCEWLHVDFDEELSGFYHGACGFTPTPAGVIALGRAPGERAARRAQPAVATPTTGRLSTTPPSDP